jgi:crotonobetainyl-CoA:carnitine CoA-transferase CaiB-like acyl-CoA transferase
MSALNGIRVLDMSRGRAGPLSAMLFADFGADVVRAAERSHPVWDRGKQFVDEATGPFDIVVTSGDTPDVDDRTVLLRVPPALDAPWSHESDALITAWYGIPLRQGSFDGGPVDSIYPVVTTLQGIWAAACGVAALIERERSGLGQVVTVAGDHGAMVAAAGALTFRYKDLENAPPRRGRGPGGTIPFYRTYECGDGEWLFFAALTPRFTQLGFEVLGLTELFDDPRLNGRGRAAMITPEHADWVTDVVAERFRTAPRADWLAKLRAIGCPSGPIDRRDGWLYHPQVEAISMRMTVDGVDMPGVPIEMSGASGGDTVAPKAAGTNGPLDGYRVLDLGAIIAGPFAASLLGDLGADVIKVEPLTGDSFRGPGFAAYNKGQRGIALDLSRDDGREVFFDLVRTADVVIDNYRPGVLSRLGIEWKSLLDVNPRIVSASITGFGDGGPYGGDAGFDPVLQAMSGMMRAQGGDSDPVFFTVPVNDVAGSATLALGSLLALFAGGGRRVSTSLTAMSVLLQTDALVGLDTRVGSRDHLGPSQTDRFHQAADGWVRIEGDVVPEGIESMTRAEVAALVPAAPARTLLEIARDPRTKELEVMHDDPRPDREGVTSGRHAHFSRTQRKGALVSPRLGGHTREVLRELGYSDARISELVASKAAGEA